VLLFFVLRRLAVPGALLAAAVFGLHPVMVESVAWITERKNVLSLFCYLAALLCYLRFERLDTADRDTADPNATAPPGPRPWKYHALALVLFACALLSKTVTCSMPAVVLLLIYWKRGRIRWPELWPTLPLFAVAVPLALYTAHLEEVRVGAVGPEWDLSLAERVLVAGRALWFYAHKLVWPGELVFIYERWQLDAGATWQWVFPVGVVVALVGLFLRRHRIGRGPVVAACIFCGTLTPALGFFSVYPMRYSFVADHFQYHASIALIALLTAALVGVFPRPGESLHLARKAHKLGLSVAVLVLAILGARTAWQCRIYKDLETLYGSILASEPDSWFAHNNLAAVYVLQDKIDDGLRHLRRAKEINPYIAANPGDETGPQISPEAFAYYQVGSILAKSIGWSTEVLPDVEKQRRLGAAIAHFEKALEIKKDYRSAWANMAAAKANCGDLAAAERDFQQALELDPQDTLCLMGMVNLHLTMELRLLQQGRTELALSHCESAKSFTQRALEAEPDNRRVRGELVKMHARMGDILFARGLRRHADLHLTEARRMQRAGPDR
ncbi:MAG: hypothetical protein ACYTF5_14135, partial [Planctomycetota bacterium]